MTVKEYLIFIFGKQRKTRYFRMLLLIIIILTAFMLIQNVSCGFDKENSFYFKWEPAADIKISK